MQNAPVVDAPVSPENLTKPDTAMGVHRISTSAAARLLELSENSIRNMADRGALPCSRVGLFRVFDVLDVLAMREQRAARRVA